MDLFLNALKGQVSTLNFLILLFSFSLIATLVRKRKMARIILGIAILSFILVSTEYLPYYLVGRIESEYAPLKRSLLTTDSEEVYIHVLGGGYNYDKRLPSSGMLNPISLGRLAEGVRIANQVPSSKLVFSGSKVGGSESMACVMKHAAMSLGIDSSRIDLFEEPRTTEEEARSFKRRFGHHVNLILVSDAIHMRRALNFFREQGLEPVPAPTNYLVREDDSPYRLRWLPSSENLLLMDRFLREWLGTFKGKIT